MLRTIERAPTALFVIRFLIMEDFWKKKKRKSSSWKSIYLNEPLELIEEKYIAAIFQQGGEGKKERKTFNVVINHRWNDIFLGWSVCTFVTWPRHTLGYFYYFRSVPGGVFISLQFIRKHEQHCALYILSSKRINLPWSPRNLEKFMHEIIFNYYYLDVFDFKKCYFLKNQDEGGNLY